VSESQYAKGTSSSSSTIAKGISWQRPFHDPLYDAPTTDQDVPESEIQAKEERSPHSTFDLTSLRFGTPTPAYPAPLVQQSLQRQESEEEPEELQPQRIQTKLTVGQPGDRYEQEADAMAARVMTMPEPTVLPVQRQEVEEDESIQASGIQRDEMPEEEEPIQARMIQREELSEEEEPVQARMIQRDEMPEEEEPVQAQMIQREELSEEEESVQARMIQRDEIAEEEEPIQAKAIATLQRRIENKPIRMKAIAAPTPTTSLEGQLHGSKGGGSPLGDETRSFMESRFNTDFSHVRVHTGSSAVQMNKDLHAQAFTHGSDIYYGAGKSPGQNDLTAHELTHVIQQTGSRKLGKATSLRLKAKGGSSHLRNKVQGDRSVPSLFNNPFSKGSSKDSEKPAAFSQVESKSGLNVASQPQFNKEAPQPKPSLASFQPTIVEPVAKGVSEAKQEVVPAKPKEAPEPLNTPSVKTAVPAPAAVPAPNLVAAPKVENAIPDMKAGVGGGSMGGAAAAPMPQLDEASAGTTSDIGGGAAEAETEQSGNDGELESIAADTAGIELESGDRADVAASMSEIAAGAAPAEAMGGGGGGGAAIADKPVPPVPDVSGSDPAQALATIGQLPPAQLQTGLGGVTAAVGNVVSQERTELAANPPQMDRPTGSAMTKAGLGDRAIPSGKKLPPVEKTPQGQAKPTPQPKPLAPLPPSPVQSVPQPASDPQAIKASLDRLPTRDPNLQVTAGAAPTLTLQGDANPQQAQAQKAKLEQSVAEAHTHGQQDLAQPMGEDEIYPHVPQETLRAEGIGAGGKAAGADLAVKGVERDDAVSMIAQQEHGQEIQAAVAQAQSQMTAKRQEHTVQVAQEKAQSNKEVTKLQSDNEALQTQERSKALTEVGKQKESWNKEQADLVGKSRKDADAAVADGMKDVQKEQETSEAKAGQEIEKGNQDAETARVKGEQDAAAEKQKGDKESGGIFGWVADKAKAFFDGIKQAIQKAFEVARAAVKLAIDTAKKLATAVIETARQAIVSIIKTVGNALIAIGDVLLAAFPEMRDRFRNAIKSAVKLAETAVNVLADKLKQGVVAALTLLGKGLDAALGLMEKGMLAAVQVANQVVQGAISAAKAAVQTLGAFAVLAKDIFANPGQWLSNLGAGVMDGIRNHLWGAFQAAVKDWFNQKVEEVLGLGLTVWNLLKQGGMGLAEIGQMAWEGIKAAIPPALIQILVEKLVSMIVPAAGAVLMIVEGLQAAWGTVSRILQAMERFIGFLKAVKSGQSGALFGQLLATAGVVLIDFVANWLLKKVRGAASKVAGKIREIAKGIGQKLRNLSKKVRQKLKGVTKNIGDRFGKLKEKFSLKKDKKETHDQQETKEEKDRRNQKRLDKAVRELQPKVNTLLRRGVSGIHLHAQLALWRVQHKLTRLSVHKQGESQAQIVAKVNPEGLVSGGYIVPWERVRLIVQEVVKELLQREDVSKVSDWMAGKTWTKWEKDQEGRLVGEEKATPPGHNHMGSEDNPLEISGGLGYLGFVKSDEERRARVAQKTANSGKNSVMNWFYQFYGEGKATIEKQKDLTSKNGHIDFPPQTREWEVYLTSLQKGDGEAANRSEKLDAIVKAINCDKQEVFSFIKGFLKTGKWSENLQPTQVVELEQLILGSQSTASNPVLRQKENQEKIQEIIKQHVEQDSKKRRVQTSYPGIFKQIDFIMKTEQLDEKEVASSIYDFVRTGYLPEQLSKYEGTISSMTGLMFGREAIRNQMTIAISPMTLDLIESGEMTWGEAFKDYENHENQRHGGRGAFPMSMRRAQKASDISVMIDSLSLTEPNTLHDKIEQLANGGKIKLKGKKEKTQEKEINELTKDVEELRSRELKVIQKWCLAKLKLTNGIFDSEQTAEKHIREEIKKEISDRYGLS
jgi:Domain of unknown function (DUF4157)